MKSESIIPRGSRSLYIDYMFSRLAPLEQRAGEPPLPAHRQARVTEHAEPHRLRQEQLGLSRWLFGARLPVRPG